MISVIVPVYNHAGFLRDAVTSALRCRMVSEVLLVDDGSSDQSYAVVQALTRAYSCVFDLTRDNKRNLGAHERLNQLVTAARNEWVAVLNSDDLFFPGRFDAIALDIRRDSADLFFGDLAIIDANGLVIGGKRAYFHPEYSFPCAPAEQMSWLPLLFNQNFIATTSNMVFKKSLHCRVGGFAPLRYCHDWDFALRAALMGRCMYVSQYFTFYRIHSTNTIKESKEKVVEDVRRAFKGILADFPQVKEDPEISLNLLHNAYLR